MVETIHLHPRKWPALIPLIVAAVMFIFISPQKNDYSVVIACSFLVLFSIVMLLALSRAEIIIENSGITHKTIFRTKEMQWQNIARTYIKYRHHGQSGSYYWFFEDANANRTRFSTRLYSR